MQGFVKMKHQNILCLSVCDFWFLESAFLCRSAAAVHTLVVEVHRKKNQQTGRTTHMLLTAKLRNDDSVSSKPRKKVSHI